MIPAPHPDIAKSAYDIVNQVFMDAEKILSGKTVTRDTTTDYLYHLTSAVLIRQQGQRNEWSVESVKATLSDTILHLDPIPTSDTAQTVFERLSKSARLPISSPSHSVERPMTQPLLSDMPELG